MKKTLTLKRLLSLVAMNSLQQLFLALCCAGLTMAAPSSGQNLLEKKINLTVHQATLSKTLHQLERTADVRFSYNSRSLPLTSLVTVDAKNQSLARVLDELLSPLKITYKQVSNQIVLRNAPPLSGATRAEESTLVASELLATTVVVDRSLVGKVTDEKGDGLPGVSIVIKGTQRGTISNADGSYSVLVPDGAQSVIFSFVGYMSEEVALSAERTALDISLKVDQKSLEEVVVVGYGTQRKSDLTGSIASVKEEDLKNLPMTSFDQALQGRVSGVQVTQASSAPGGRVMIRIRGGNSLSSGNEPLYVVDGYPITAGATAGGNGAGQNPLSSINPSDIASIEILKDASATAIYGSRGANGVVLITTKRGKTGKTQVSYDAYYGVQTVGKKLDMMNAREFAQLANEARANSGIATPAFPNPLDPYNFPDINSLGDGVDYQREIFRKAGMQNHNVNISGGTETTRFSVSGSFFGQDGVVKNSDFQRASIKTNFDTKLSNNLILATNFAGSKIWGNNGRSEGDGGSGGGYVNSALVMPPTVKIFQEDGSYTRLNPTPGGSTVPNPVPMALLNLDKQVIDRFMGSAALTWNIISDLSLKVSVGTDMSTAARETYEPRETVAGYNANGRATQASRRSVSYLNENILTYNKQFDQHSVNVLAGYTLQYQQEQQFGANASDFLTDLYGANNLGAGARFTNPSSWKNQNQLVSYLGRINYSFRDKYLISMTGRADGSSKFGANNKWAFFPSVAVGWKLSEEDFLKSVDQISGLKIRASYGLTGNQNIASYQSLARLGVLNYPLGGALNSGLGANNIPNPDLKWETTATTDIGIDLDLFNNRINLVADYYYKKTTDLLWNISIPLTSGFGSIFKNVGSLENKGLELSLGGVILERDFKWNTNLNWSRNRNKVLEIPGFTPSVQGSISGHLKVDGSWLEPGLPVGVWNLLKYDGVFQDQVQLDAGPKASTTDALGDPRFVDKNGDGSVSFVNDRMIVGDPNPNFIFGWSNNFSYKGFDLAVYMQGSYGNDVLNVQRAESNVSSPWGNQRREILNRWTPTNTNTNVSRARVTVNPLLLQSSWLIEDGSFLRVKTATLGYTFQPNKGIRSVRLYVTGQNLLTFTKYTGFDPEVNSTGNSNLQLGVDYNAYPMAKAVLMGLNVSF
jgi:TonB-linked SusC/RagA family outer membrane protein